MRTKIFVFLMLITSALPAMAQQMGFDNGEGQTATPLVQTPPFQQAPQTDQNDRAQRSGQQRSTPREADDRRERTAIDAAEAELEAAVGEAAGAVIGGALNALQGNSSDNSSDNSQQREEERKEWEEYKDEVAQFAACWSCDFIRAAARTMGELSRSSYQTLATPIRQLAGLLFAFLFFIEAAKLLMPFTPLQGGQQVMNRLFGLGGATMLAVLALSSPDFFWNYLLRPVIDVAFGFSNIFVDIVGLSSTVSCSQAALPGSIEADAALLGEQLACQTRSIASAYSFGAQVGWITLTKGFDLFADFNIANPLTWLPAVRFALYFISGAVLLVLFVRIGLMFMFAIIDVIMRWALIAALAPLQMTAFAFKPTRKFGLFGWRGMIESMVALILLSLVGALITVLISDIGMDWATTNDTLVSGDQYLQQLYDGEVRPPLVTNLQWWTLAAIGLMAGEFIPRMRDMAAKLANSQLMHNVDYRYRGLYTQGIGSATTMGATALSFSSLNSVWDNTGGRVGSLIMGRHLDGRKKDLDKTAQAEEDAKEQAKKEAEKKAADKREEERKKKNTDLPENQPDIPENPIIPEKVPDFDQPLPKAANNISDFARKSGLNMLNQEAKKK